MKRQLNKVKRQSTAVLHDMRMLLSISVLIAFSVLSFGENELSTQTELVAGEQDELSADVQELVELQTQEEIIKKLEELEETMVEVTLRLTEGETDGTTIAGQTEIIEKVYEAAKKKKNQGEGSETSDAMMEMLEKMMGKGASKKQGEEKEQKSPNAGQGQKGDTSSVPESSELATEQILPSAQKRTVPRVSGSIEAAIPDEFQEMLDDYNRKRSQR